MWVYHPFSFVSVKTYVSIDDDIYVVFDMDKPFCYSMYDEFIESKIYLDYDVIETYVFFDD
jgi:hypothetical protein